MVLACYLIPQWNGAALETLSLSSASATGNGLMMTLWLAIPVMVEEYGAGAEKKCSSILARAHIMMVLTVMFFVFSCVLSLSPADGSSERAEHLHSVLRRTTLTHRLLRGWHRSSPLSPSPNPSSATTGAREGFNGMVIKSLRGKGKSIEISKLNKITALFMLLTTGPLLR